MSIEKFAVIGNPIEHSKSPFIHQAFAAQFNKKISYERVLAPLDHFADTVKQLQTQTIKVSMSQCPLSFEAYQLSQAHLSQRALTAGEAVNTLSFVAGNIYGDNTDGVGLRNDIEMNLGFEIHGKNILILGAGGAAHGVLMSLIEANSITIAIAPLRKRSK